MSIFIEKNRPALVLAPMEGVTDAPMRALLTQLGGFQYCVSEFIRISQELLPDKVFHRHVPELSTGGKTAYGTPVQVQLLGGDAEKLATTAQQLVRLGALAIDINFGCPAPTVNRHDGGATLLKYPERIEEIVSSVRAAVPSFIPVSAKLRLGWEKMEDIFENARRVENGGASWMTIHARTRLQGYSPPAHWQFVGEVIRQRQLPVVVNGDIWSVEAFDACVKITGAKHFMLGRGALSEPGLAKVIAQKLGLPVETPALFERDLGRWIMLLEEFHSLNEGYAERTGYSVRRIKQWMNIANKRGDFPWFKEIKKSQTIEELFEILRNQLSSCQVV